MEERVHYIQDLGDYLIKTRATLNGVAERLGWSVNKNAGQCEPRMVTCPVNSEHRLPEKSLHEHLKVCEWKSKGYSEDSIPLPESCSDGAKSIVIDSELAEQICKEAAAQYPNMLKGMQYTSGALKMGCRPVPQTSDDLFATYTLDERRAIYEYVVSNTGGAGALSVEDLQLPFNTDQKESQQKSMLELLAEERDAKRRRISYRSKKVSTNRKSYTEVLREVIKNQMEMYESLLENNIKEEDDHEGTCGSSVRSDNDDGKEYGNGEDSSRSKQNDVEERLSRRHSGDLYKHNQAGTSRDRYEDRQHNYREYKYDRRDRDRHKHSEQEHSREHYHRRRSRSRERYSSWGEASKYRDKGQRDKYYRHSDTERENRVDRDKYYRPSDTEREREKTSRDKERRESSQFKEERQSEYGNRSASRKQTLSEPVKIKAEIMTVGDNECKSFPKPDDAIFEDMQRLLEAHERADEERDRYKSFNKPVSVVHIEQRNPDRPTRDHQYKEDEADYSHGHSKHKSRSHMGKKKKKKSKKHKYKKHSDSSGSSEQSDSSY